jgi:hypothetical protein
MLQLAIRPWKFRAAVFFWLLLSAAPLYAQVITVSNADDSGPGSLRDAIANAQDGYTINFNLPIPATILLNSPLTLGPSVTIAGPGASNLAISGGDGVGVFIVNAGATVTIFGVTIEHGSSLLGGGIFNAGDLTLTTCAISNNAVGTQLGGGIFNSGTLSLVNSTVSGNGAGVPGELAYGGGIYNYSGTVTLTNTTVSNNTAGNPQSKDSFGGGIYNQATLILTNSGVSHNSAVGSNPLPAFPLSSLGTGGGIVSFRPSFPGPFVALTLTNSTVSGNTAQSVGGIYSDGILDSAGSAVYSNQDIYQAGGIFMGPDSGGRLFNSTIWGNACGSAQYPYCGVSEGGAGGVNFLPPRFSLDQFPFYMVFSTISGNSCYGPACAGGLLGNGGQNAVFGGAFMYTTILANNSATQSTAGNCSTLTFGPAIAFSLGYNLSDDSTCASSFARTSDLNNTPAGLASAGLQDNGGPSNTVALVPGSLAVNAIPASSCTDPSSIFDPPVTADQRGVRRPQGSGCDIGAYELQSIPGSGICNGIFNGTFKGDLVVSNGDICNFFNGAITGNVVQTGGNLTLTNVTVAGNVQATGGTRYFGPSTIISGNLLVQNVPSAAAQDSVCGLKLQGNLQFQNNGIALLYGSPSCLGNSIGGNVQISKNSAATQLYGTTVTGNLDVSYNSAAVQLNNNTVTGNLQVQDNGSVEIFSNTVRRNLQCGGNTTITGGGNVVSGKMAGQCASF